MEQSDNIDDQISRTGGGTTSEDSANSTEETSDDSAEATEEPSDTKETKLVEGEESTLTNGDDNGTDK